jgi:DNA-directed RNA polymerase specialized sigma24 family protein
LSNLFLLNGNSYSSLEISEGLQVSNSHVANDLIATIIAEKTTGATDSEGLRAIDSIFSSAAREWLRKKHRKITVDLLEHSKPQALMYCFQRIEKYDANILPLSSWIFQQYNYALLVDIRLRAKQREGELLGLDDLLQEIREEESKANSVSLNAADQRKFEEHFNSKAEFDIVDKDVVDRLSARKAYERLTEGERTVLFYRHVWGLKPQEMIDKGLIEGQSVGALKVYLTRAMKKLHGHLEKEGFSLE